MKNKTVTIPVIDNRTPSTKVPMRMVQQEDFDDMADTLGNLLQDDLSEFLDEDQITNLCDRIIKTLMGQSSFETVDYALLEQKLVNQATIIQELKEQLTLPMTMNDFKNRKYNQMGRDYPHLHTEKHSKTKKWNDAHEK